MNLLILPVALVPVSHIVVKRQLVTAHLQHYLRKNLTDDIGDHQMLTFRALTIFNLLHVYQQPH